MSLPQSCSEKSQQREFSMFLFLNIQALFFRYSPIVISIYCRYRSDYAIWDCERNCHWM